jgi:PAS domain S-box-containing protein
MTEITDFNFAEDDFTAVNLAKFKLIKSEEVEVLNDLADHLNQIVASKVAKLCQKKDEFYGKQIALKELESDTFYNHSPSGYFSTDGNGIIDKINDTLLVWLGYAKEDIIGKVTWQSLLSAGGKMYFETHYLPMLQMQGFVQEISFEMVKKDKTRLPILINTKQIRDENGKVQINHSSVFDVSQRKSYEKELLIAKRTAEDQNKLINETNEKLLASQETLKSKIKEVKTLNKSLNEYAHVVSHDLKSPLRSIHTLISWIQEDSEKEFSGQTQEYLNRIKDKVEKIDNLIQGILTYSKVEVHKRAVEKIDLNEVVRNTVETIYIPKNITVTITNALPTMETNSFIMYQLFQNLISNAVNYNDKEKGVIEIASTQSAKYYIFSVKDNGIGIDLKYQEKIFQMFESYSKNAQSTGIGLAIVKKIVDQYNGKIWLESQEGIGTTFYIKMPKKYEGAKY